MSFQSPSGPTGFRVAERKWPVVKQRKYQGILIEQIVSLLPTGKSFKGPWALEETMCCRAISHLIVCLTRSEQPSSQHKHCPGGHCLPLARQVRLPGDGAQTALLGLLKAGDPPKLGEMQNGKGLSCRTEVCSKGTVSTPACEASGDPEPRLRPYSYKLGLEDPSFQKPENPSIRGRHKRR